MRPGPERSGGFRLCLPLREDRQSGFNVLPVRGSGCKLPTRWGMGRGVGGGSHSHRGTLDPGHSNEGVRGLTGARLSPPSLRPRPELPSGVQASAWGSVTIPAPPSPRLDCPPTGSLLGPGDTETLQEQSWLRTSPADRERKMRKWVICDSVVVGALTLPVLRPARSSLRLFTCSIS